MTNIIFFLTLMIPITWSSGPNNIMCILSGSKYGVSRTIPFILGLNIPILFYSIATGFGLGIITAKYPQTIEFLKYIGGIYVFYLGLKILKTQIEPEHTETNITFKESVTVILLMYSQFSHSNTNILIQTLTLSTAFALLCVIGHFGWATIGQISSKYLLSPKALKRQNYIFSALLFLTGIWIFFN